MTHPESPEALTGGVWTLGPNRVLVWVTVAEVLAADRYDVGMLIACPTCHARVDQLCRTRTGRHRSPHLNRLVVKRCGCGERLGYNRKLCDGCRDGARRENARIGMRNTRARRRAARAA